MTRRCEAASGCNRLGHLLAAEALRCISRNKDSVTMRILLTCSRSAPLHCPCAQTCLERGLNTVDAKALLLGGRAGFS